MGRLTLCGWGWGSGGGRSRWGRLQAGRSSVGSIGARRGARSTDPPVGDLRLVDDEAEGVLGNGAWDGADRAGDVTDPAAPPADQVVVVVAAADLEAHRRARRHAAP